MQVHLHIHENSASTTTSTKVLSAPSIWTSIVVLLLILETMNRLTRTLCNYTRKIKLPPSPFTLPVVGNLHQIGKLPHRSLYHLSQKHGPLMLLRLGTVPVLVVASPEMAQEIMKTQDHIFCNRPSLMVPRKLFYGPKDIAFSPYGEYWRRARKFAVHHLLNHKKVQSYRSIREEEVLVMVDKVRKLSSEENINISINMSEIISCFAKDATSRIALGKCSRDNGWNEAIDEMIEECNKLLGVFHIGDFFPSFAWISKVIGLDARVKRTFHKVDRILEDIVEACLKDRRSGTESFVDVLLSFRKETSATTEFCFGRDSVKAILEDLFGAGTDATIIVLEWALAELLKNPESMTNLKEEIAATVGTKSAIDEADLIRMDFLKAVLKETMRLHPPGPLLVPRELTEDTEISGYHVPGRTRVLVNAFAIGRDPKAWENADVFQPERFIGASLDFRGQDFELIPFGAGRRMCPGIHFARSIIELALANLVHHFDWELPERMTGDDLDMTEAPGFASRKRVPLQILAKPCL